MENTTLGELSHVPMGEGHNRDPSRFAQLCLDALGVVCRFLDDRDKARYDRYPVLRTIEANDGTLAEQGKDCTD